MKKFSTAALTLAFASAIASQGALAAASNVPEVGTSRCQFLDKAPDQHVVVRGDTLWGISGKFLQNPWCWPHVWGMNKEQIRDPHWIYPGQIVYLDRVNGRLRLGKPVAAAEKDNQYYPTNVHLVPQLRMEGLGQQAIPAISASDIEPFLSQPLVIEEGQLLDVPRIMATQEGRVMLGKGDKAFVRGDLKGGTSFQVFRPGIPLKDPDGNAVIGYEAVYLGTVKLQRAAKTDAEAHIFNVVNFKEEMTIGDRLMPVPPTPILNYAPHPPEKQVDARIVSIYGGVTHAGQNQIVAINRGKNDGIDLGTVLELYRYGQIVADRTDDKKPVKLPDEQYGTLFIFRAFNKIAYGLIMQVTDAVQVGDVAKSPE